jgi:hypothetical protein
MPIFVVKGRASYNVYTEIEADSEQDARQKADKLPRNKWLKEYPACPGISSGEELWITEKS